jgi:small conductance mechanosensitive channel
MVNVSQAFEDMVGKLGDWLNSAILALPNVVAALLVVFGFWILARIVVGALDRLLKRLTSHSEVRRLLIGLMRLAILAVGLFVALGILDLDKTVTSLLGAAGILGIVAGLAFQDLAANFFAGILLAVRQPFRVGHLIETNDYFGIAERVNLRATELRLLDGRLALVPNKDVFQNTIVNYSKNSVRRVELEVGVSYGDDLEHVRQVTIAAVEGVDGRDTSRPVELFYTGFGDSSVNFEVRFWVPFVRQPDYLAARSDAIMRIRHAYNEAGVTIPFPIRTLDFGIVGGQKLSAMWPASMTGRTPAS